MKKFLMITSFVVAAFAVKAQVSYGVNAGGVLSSFKTEFDGKKREGEKGKVGFKVGLSANVPLSGGLSFTPELNFVSKGGKVSTTEEQNIFGGSIKQVSESTINTSYLEIPLNVTYSLNSDEEMSSGLFFGAGPTLSYGVGGKYNSTNTVTTVFSGTNSTSTTKADGKVKFDGKKVSELAPSDTDEHFKGFEFGVNAFVGYNFTPNINARVMYNYGLSNIDPNDKSKANNSYLGLTLGYKF